MVSVLAPECIATGKVYVSKHPGGGAFGAPSDVTGDGSAAKPFLTGTKMIEEIRNLEFIDRGLSEYSQPWVGRFLAKLGENNVYSDPLYFQNILTSAFKTTAENKLDLQGHPFEAGDLDFNDVGKWTTDDGSDKPTIGGIIYLNATNDKTFHMHLKDLVFTNATGSSYGPVYQYGQQGNQMSYGDFILFGCLFNGTSLPNFAHTSYWQYIGIMACIVKNQPQNYFINRNTSQLVFDRSYVDAGSKYGFQWQGSTSGRYMYAINSLGVSDASTLMYSSNGWNAHEFCGYELLNGANLVFDYDDSTTYASINDLPDKYINYTNNYGYEGDIKIVDRDNPRLLPASPLNRRGGKFIGSWSHYNNATLDTNSARGWHKYDFRNDEWNPRIKVVNQHVYNNQFQYYEFNYGDVGPFRNTPLSHDAPIIVDPVGNVDYTPEYIALKVPATKHASPGTVQGKTIVYLNGLDTIDWEGDTFPIKIDANNKDIDFKVNGAATIYSVSLDLGDFNLADLFANAKAKMEAAVAGATFDFTRPESGEVYLTAGGTASTVQLLNGTGPNFTTSVANTLGWLTEDTEDDVTVTAQLAIVDNKYDASLPGMYCNDYVEGENSKYSGTWVPCGIGEPGEGKTPGQDGCDDDGSHYLRLEVPPGKSLQNKDIVGALTNGAKLPSYRAIRDSF